VFVVHFTVFVVHFTESLLLLFYTRLTCRCWICCRLIVDSVIHSLRVRELVSLRVSYKMSHCYSMLFCIFVLSIWYSHVLLI